VLAVVFEKDVEQRSCHARDRATTRRYARVIDRGRVFE
jgi:hypothetical protein